ncbi:putative PEP-binding protein [Natrialbaceae archaeon A-CW1-1]
MPETPQPFQQGTAFGPQKQISGQLIRISDRDGVNNIENGNIVYVLCSEIQANTVIFFNELVKSGAAAILCDTIGETDHGVLLANEHGVPCFSDIPQSISKYEGEIMTVEGDSLYLGAPVSKETSTEIPHENRFPDTNTEIKINLGFPKALNRHPKLSEVSDGVGFMRLEFVLLDVLQNIHPKEYINRFGREELETQLADRIEPVLEVYSDPVWIRTDDFTRSQLAEMERGDRYEETEKNPMLGWRGIARSIERPTLYNVQLGAISRLLERGHENIGLFPPMTRFPSEYIEWRSRAEDAGLSELSYGTMIETPAAALTFREFTEYIDFVVFGSNDLTQFTLAIDRGNKHLSPKFDEKETAVLKLFEHVISIAKEEGIVTCIGGRAASDEALGQELLSFGIDALSVNPDPTTLAKTHQFVNRFEHKN